MRTIAAMLLFGIVFAGISAAQNCTQEAGKVDYKSWVEKSGLSEHAYQASTDREQKITYGAKKLKLGMPRSQVQQLLGKPDFTQLRQSGHGYPSEIPGAPKSCDYEWAYIIAKDGTNLADMSDTALFVFFSEGDKLFWIAPQNIKGVEAKGSPEPPVTEK